MSNFPSHSWDFVRFESMQALWMLSQSLWIQVCNSHAIAGRLLPMSHLHPVALTVFQPLLNRSLGSRGAVFWRYFTKDRVIKVSHMLCIVKLRVPVLNTIYWMEKFLWSVLNNTLIYWYSSMSLGWILLSYCISRLIAADSPLRNMT